MSVDNEYRKVLKAMTTAGGISQEKVEAAERDLGVRFPAPYVEFLTQYGAAFGKGFELAGLFDESNEERPPMWSSVVLATKQLRRVPGSLAWSLIFISDDGQDVKF